MPSNPELCAKSLVSLLQTHRTILLRVFGYDRGRLALELRLEDPKRDHTRLVWSTRIAPSQVEDLMMAMNLVQRQRPSRNCEVSIRPGRSLLEDRVWNGLESRARLALREYEIRESQRMMPHRICTEPVRSRKPRGTEGKSGRG